MPYLILIIGVFVGLYALYRFFISASVAQVKALFFTAVLCVIGVAVLLLSLTGRLPAALAILVAVVPIAMSVRKSMKARDDPNGDIILRDDEVEILSDEADFGKSKNPEDDPDKDA